MKLDEDLFESWVPEDGPWSAWCKPVGFLVPKRGEAAAPGASGTFKTFPAPSPDTAVVLEVPGPLAVDMGLLFAEFGFQPVPLFNATHGNCSAGNQAVPVGEIYAALKAGAPRIAGLHFATRAAPVFLLDCRRLGRGAPRPGMYDNRSVLLPQDVPSARRLKAAGIRSITLIQAPGAVAKDLTHLLYAWQQGGLHLLRNEPFSTAPPESFHLRKPLGFGSMLHDLMVRAGLRRSSQGGFGGTVPLPQQTGTGYHSYGRMG